VTGSLFRLGSQWKPLFEGDIESLIAYSRPYKLWRKRILAEKRQCQGAGWKWPIQGTSRGQCWWTRQRPDGPGPCKEGTWFSKCFFCLFVYLFVFGGTRVWTQCFVLAKQTFYCLSHTSSPFFSGYFRDAVLWTICPGRPWTVILPISDFQVARIAGMSHWHLAVICAFKDGSGS
jgi:hypothetical protein